MVLNRRQRLGRVVALCPGQPVPAGAEQHRCVEHLLDISRRHRLDGWLLVPCADEETRLVSQNHAALSGVFRLRTPPWDIMQWAYDKHCMNERAPFARPRHSAQLRHWQQGRRRQRGLAL
jgi:hypothetical protein